MSLFENIDLRELFDNKSNFGKRFRFETLTEEMISRAEKTIG